MHHGQCTGMVLHEQVLNDTVGIHRGDKQVRKQLAYDRQFLADPDRQHTWATLIGNNVVAWAHDER